MTSDSELFFTYLVAIYLYVIFGKISVQILCLLFNQNFFFFPAVELNVFLKYILDANPLSDLQIFSPLSQAAFSGY